MSRNLIGFTSVLGIAVLTLLGLAWAGSLDPPAAPAPTMKTLEDIEPRIPISASDLPLNITTSGSYYLVENVENASGGISTGKAQVEFFLDLNGHTLHGATGNSDDGIFLGNVSACRISNGTVEGWDVNGISATRCVIEDVVARNNGTGIYGAYSVIRNSIAVSNLNAGFQLSTDSLLMESVSTFNGADGVRFLSTGATVRGCSISHNSQYGIHIPTGVTSHRIENNTLSANGTDIYILGTENLVIGNSAFDSATHYDIAPGNDVGPIGTAATSTSPWANFTD